MQFFCVEFLYYDTFLYAFVDISRYSHKFLFKFFAGGVGHGRDGIAELVALSLSRRHRLQSRYWRIHSLSCLVHFHESATFVSTSTICCLTLDYFSYVCLSLPDHYSHTHSSLAASLFNFPSHYHDPEETVVYRCLTVSSSYEGHAQITYTQSRTLL